MLYSGLFKRVIPFVLTFAAGLFIASFFVSLALPSVGGWRSERRFGKCHRARHLEKENMEMQERLRVLEIENQRLRQHSSDWSDSDLINAVPPVAVEAPHPPPPPRRPKHRHFE